MEPITFIITGGVIASLLAYKAFQTKRLKITKTIRQAPFKRIGLIEDGETVTIGGNVVFHEHAINAPLSGRKCVYYHATVERKKNVSNKSGTKWSKIIDEAAAVDFIIDDGTNLALVEANAIEGFLEMDEHFKSGIFNDPTDTQKHFLRKYNQPAKGILGANLKMRYKEGALEEHEYCIICGTCYWQKGVDYDLKDHEDILLIKASKEQAVYITDVKDILTKKNIYTR